MNQPTTTESERPVSGAPVPSQAWLMLALATIGFAVNFWAWALLSPLGPRFKDSLDLSSFQQSLLMAVPVVVGSLGRIPVGALTDRFGGRVMFPIVSAATIVPVLYLGLAGHSSLASLPVGGFFLGIGGTAFAVGVPFVNAWFPPERRGMAIGVFGAGMGGTAISALTTVKLLDAHSMSTPFLITAAVLAVYAVAAVLLLRDAPGRTVPTEPLGRRLTATARLGITWQASALYAVAFGGSLSVYLPTCLKTGYGLTQADAANRVAGFVLLAVAMRPVGGWLSDRIGPVRVLAASLTVVAAGAVVQSFTPSLAPVGTILPGHGRRARRGQRGVRRSRLRGRPAPTGTPSTPSPRSSAARPPSISACARTWWPRRCCTTPRTNWPLRTAGSGTGRRASANPCPAARCPS
jgi:NNP family nitrate/nitrite transporter-like MFS transporter